MKKVAVWGSVAAFVTLLAVGILAQSTNIRPGLGTPWLSFRVIAKDTVQALPTRSYSGGLVDTTFARTNYVEVQALGNHLRYAYGIRPTRAKQIAVPCSAAAVQDSGARGTMCLLPTATDLFEDSMYVYFRGTTGAGTAFDDSLFLVVKKYTKGILINKKYVAYTFNTDTCYAAETGFKLHKMERLPLFDQYIRLFRFENWTASTPCTVDVNQGTGRGSN